MQTANDHWRPFSNLHGFVRLILLVDWDPLGVFGIPDAMDEYDSYVGEICELLKSGAAREDLIEHLDVLETQRIGVKPYLSRQTGVVDKMLDLRFD
jgi:hypothetical protein